MLYKDAEEYGITRSQIVFHEDATMTRDVLSESDLIKGIYEYNDRQIKALTDSIARLETQLDAYREGSIPVDAIARELFAQYPFIKGISLSEGPTVNASGTEGKKLDSKVEALLPSDANNYKNGETVKAVDPAETTVMVEDGVWSFAGYDKKEAKVDKADVVFTGKWTFAEVDTKEV